VDQKLFAKQQAEIFRQYNISKDEIENQESRNRIKKLQLYLEENTQLINEKKIDRVSVWLNHN